MIKGSNIFVGQKLANLQLDRPVECASGCDPLLLYKILHLMFIHLVQILCALHSESRKNYQHGVDAGPMEFQFLQLRECCFVSGSCVSSFLYALAIAIMSWQDVTRSSLCSGVKECGT